MPRARPTRTVQSRARALALARRKARLERRRDFLTELERARSMTPQQRLQMGLDMTDILMEFIQGAAQGQKLHEIIKDKMADAPDPKRFPNSRNQKNTRHR